MRKNAPALARIALGFRGETVSGPVHTKEAPAAAAVRMMVPRLPGSWMPQANRTSAFCPARPPPASVRENAPEQWLPGALEHRKPTERGFRLSCRCAPFRASQLSQQRVFSCSDRQNFRKSARCRSGSRTFRPPPEHESPRQRPIPVGALRDPEEISRIVLKQRILPACQLRDGHSAYAGGYGFNSSVKHTAE